MKKQLRIKQLIWEVVDLISKFFKPYGLKDELLEVPTDIKRMGTKVELMDFGMSIISLIFAFMLKITNMMIEYKFIVFGIVLFMLYRGQDVINEAFYLWESSENKKFDLIFEDEIVLRGSKIIGKTANKVLKFDSNSKLYTTMSNESVLNTIKQYLQNLWKLKVQTFFDFLEIMSVFVMLFIAIATNTAISQSVFVPLVLGFCVISFFSVTYITLSTEQYYQRYKKYNNEQSVIVNDLLRVPTIVEKDMEMRIGKFQKSIAEKNQNVKSYHKKINLSRIFISATQVFAQYGIIIGYLIGVDWNTINIGTISEITATLVIVETALSKIQKIAVIMNNHNERVIIMNKEEQDMELILKVYHEEEEKRKTTHRIENLRIKPFAIRYLEESENDKPFTLTSKDEINIKDGEIVILYGPSGSGKSTFMKMLTERIRVEKSTDIPSTSRFLFYDEKLKFGSLNIFDELFCCSENPDLVKMQEILENLHLWSEIKANCFEVWKWMKQKQFEQSLSNGQKQRMILAKMLYWLDAKIDVLVLDECTSGLDDKSETDSADAERILEYIVRFANFDKKRIVIISTHQNIDGFKKKLENEYSFRNLKFAKEGEMNLVKEI